MPVRPNRGKAGCSPSQRLRNLDWTSINNSLDEAGYAHLPALLSAAETRNIKALYANPGTKFRKTVVMAQHNFGDGEYKYFAYPLPQAVARLRQSFYAHLAPIANRWAALLGDSQRWPTRLSSFTRQCATAGQDRATPLLLSYRPGGYNRLHQDIYGDCYFPFQVVILLDRPGIDFSGGEFLLLENQPRTQARSRVLNPALGDAVIFPVRERPLAGKQRISRCRMRHGVSTVHSGNRTTLGLIFHDA